MFCPSCGSEIPNEAAFCPMCGAANPNAQAMLLPTPVDNPADYSPATYDRFYEPTPTLYGPSPFVQQNTGPNTRTSVQYPPAGNAPVAGMPNKTLALVLIVVGFFCGVIWGVIGISQYGAMKQAITFGDVQTAQKKFKIIAISTAIGIAFNLLLVLAL